MYVSSFKDGIVDSLRMVSTGENFSKPYFNFNFNLFILYHIHQYHEYILHTFTYIFIDRRRIQGPI